MSLSYHSSTWCVTVMNGFMVNRFFCGSSSTLMLAETCKSCYSLYRKLVQSHYSCIDVTMNRTNLHCCVAGNGAVHRKWRSYNRSCEAWGLTKAAILLWPGILNIPGCGWSVWLWTNGLCYEGKPSDSLEEFLCSWRADVGSWFMHADSRNSA